MSDELRNFLKANQDLLKKNDFATLIRKAGSLRPELIDFLYNKANIDVLKFLNEIPSSLFEGTNIASIIVPQHINKIGRQGIFNCGVVRLAIENPNIQLPSDAIVANSELQIVNLPDGLKSLPSGFCSSCENLKKVRIPASVIRIGARAFTNCNDDFILITPYRENQKDRLVIPQSEVDFYKKHLRFTHAPKNVEVKNEI